MRLRGCVRWRRGGAVIVAAPVTLAAESAKHLLRGAGGEPRPLLHGPCLCVLCVWVGGIGDGRARVAPHAVAARFVLPHAVESACANEDALGGGGVFPVLFGTVQ